MVKVNDRGPFKDDRVLTSPMPPRTGWGSMVPGPRGSRSVPFHPAHGRERRAARAGRRPNRRGWRICPDPSAALAPPALRRSGGPAERGWFLKSVSFSEATKRSDCAPVSGYAGADARNGRPAVHIRPSHIADRHLYGCRRTLVGTRWSSGSARGFERRPAGASRHGGIRSEPGSETARSETDRKS